MWPAAIERKNDLQTGFGDPFGGQNFGYRYWSGEYDGVFILNDINVLAERLQILKAGPDGATNTPEAPIIYYFPIDSYFVHEAWLHGVGHSDAPVAYNHFAKDLVTGVNKNMGERCGVIPHGSDVENFYRIEDREEVRKFRKEYFNVDDDTVLFVQVARNQVRKANGDIILAFHGIRNRYKDLKTKLYFHMHPEDSGPHQHGAAMSLGLKVGEDVMFNEHHNPGRAADISHLNMIYNAADVFVTATLGEGWGLPVTEAMAAMAGQGSRKGALGSSSYSA